MMFDHDMNNPIIYTHLRYCEARIVFDRAVCFNHGTDPPYHIIVVAS